MRFRARVHVLAAEGIPEGDGAQCVVTVVRGRKGWGTPEAGVDGGAALWDCVLNWDCTVVRRGGAGGSAPLAPKEYSLKIQRREGSRFRTVCKGHLNLSEYLSLDTAGMLPTPAVIRLSPGGGQLSVVVGGDLLHGTVPPPPQPVRDEISPLPSPKDWADTCAIEQPAAVGGGPTALNHSSLRGEDDLAGLVAESLTILASSSEEEMDTPRRGSLWGKVRRTFTPARAANRSLTGEPGRAVEESLPGTPSNWVGKRGGSGAEREEAVPPSTFPPCPPPAPAKEVDYAAAGLEAAGEPATQTARRPLGGPEPEPGEPASAVVKDSQELRQEVVRLTEALERAISESQTRGARLQMLEADMSRTQSAPGRVELLDELISSKLRVASLEGEMVDLRGQLWQQQQENRRLEARLSEAEAILELPEA